MIRVLLGGLFFLLTVTQYCFAQPGPDQFLHGLKYIDADSGAHTSVALFYEEFDTVFYNKCTYYGEQADTVLGKSQRARLVNLWLQSGTVFGVHYLNSQKKDVYVYVYCEHSRGGIVDLYSNGVVALDDMDLEQGTYFVDWSRNQQQPFHQQIVAHAAVSDAKLQLSLDSLERQHQRLYLSRNKRIAAEAHFEQEKQRLRDASNRTKFLGYYELYDHQIRHRLEIRPYELDSYVFIVKQKAVEAQQVSSEAVPPEVLIAYLETGQCANDEVAGKILGVFDR